MPQYPKDETRDRIRTAALKEFATRGYAASSMAAIAKTAGVATGNIYTYFPNKDALFRDVVPDEFAKAVTRLLRARVKALSGVTDVRTLEPGAPYRVISEELLRFCIENRFRMVVLLAKAEGTEHARFADETVDQLVKLALLHARSIGKAPKFTRSLRFALDRIYRNFVTAMVDTLATFDDEQELRAAVAHISDYHLAGMKMLFETSPQTEAV
ncbi:MAG TPA: helix-turn-helix domain-containing protein [Labilithrix sp.]|nr:helix-turn-helix domain-containing protein [Labilithrix sp.]